MVGWMVAEGESGNGWKSLVPNVKLTETEMVQLAIVVNSWP